MKATAYLLQATLISLWWVGLLLSDNFYAAFQFPGVSKPGFYSFLLPDVIIVAGLSLMRAYWSKKELEYLVLGGFGYGALYCINASLLTQGGYLATITMILGLFYNIFLVFQDFAFRTSISNNAIVNGIKTFIQILCAWGITLVVLPWFILEAFGQAQTVPAGIPLKVGLALFIACSALGLASAYYMVKFGNGTPLPIDQTTRLVVKGPYRYVRNPMAVAGIGQGIAVGVMFSSVPIVIYALLGAVLWHVAVRPIEEKNMLVRFGAAYEDYRRKVTCWIPRRSI